MTEKNLGPGDPTSLPKEVHNLLFRPTRPISPCRLADTKASILMGASFVVFSIRSAISRKGEQLADHLSCHLFLRPTIFGVLTSAQTAAGAADPAERSYLFFGSYTNARARIMRRSDQGAVVGGENYRRMAADLYDPAAAREDKFRWLYWSFTAFLVGMVATAVAVVIQLMR